ncbi:MAG: 30S ribosomal protein S12 methylthiotransferase RimO [Lachnospiraceae bacterium]|nr:30S ribosomal protein S12 methylthiotransferase RimO [Lachnospiraceae bacterium]
MKLFFLSLGCDKNLSDSEHMLKLIADAGFELTDDEAEADIAVINSCSFIGDAKKESIAEILRLASYKKKGRLKVLIVAVCLSERYGDQFEELLPEVDGILGTASWDRIVSVIEDALSGKRPKALLQKDRLPDLRERILTTGGHYAYLKIAEGCDKACTYCIIPYLRGPYRSIPEEALLEEAETLVNGGVRELILVAQETTRYGVDLYGEKRLPQLLKKLAAIPELVWIRILYTYPEEITDELVEVIRTEEKVVKYLDIPVQHASDTILRRMGRRTTRAGIEERIRKIREAVPDIVLRTTLITGFPGETEEDVQELLDFTAANRFDRLGVFCYSREEGTAAAGMKEQVPQRVKKKRRDAVMALQQQIAFEDAKKRVGSVLRCMVEGRLSDEPDTYAARSEMDAPDVDGYVFFHSDTELMSGSFVDIRITASHEYDLIGEMTE